MAIVFLWLHAQCQPDLKHLEWCSKPMGSQGAGQEMSLLNSCTIHWIFQRHHQQELEKVCAPLGIKAVSKPTNTLPHVLSHLGKEEGTNEVRASQLAQAWEWVVLQYQLYNRVGTLLTFWPDALAKTSTRFQPCCEAGIGELPLLKKKVSKAKKRAVVYPISCKEINILV